MKMLGISDHDGLHRQCILKPSALLVSLTSLRSRHFAVVVVGGGYLLLLGAQRPDA